MEFWSLTPKETILAIEAASWRAEQEQRGRLVQAWYGAVLERSKRLPNLKTLLKPKAAKVLSEEEAAVRRAEFEEAKAAWRRRAHR